MSKQAMELALEALSGLEEYAREFSVSGVYLADEIEGNRLLEKSCDANAALKEAIKQQSEQIEVAEVAAGKLGNRLMWATEDAQTNTPVGTKLYKGEQA